MQLPLRNPELTEIPTIENLAGVYPPRSISCSESAHNNLCRILIYLLSSKSIVNICKEIGQDQSRGRRVTEPLLTLSF